MKSKHIVKMKSTLLQAFTCTYCEQYFSSLGAQKRHVMRHKSKYLRWIKAKKKRSPFIRSVWAPYQCAVCNASFVKISSLENHVKVNHILVAAYGCNVCSLASFQDSDSYVRHVADHVENTLKLKAPYQCVYCKQCFVITYMLKRHLKAKHKEMNLLAMKCNLKVFQCSYCKECFVDTIKLQIHIGKTHGIDRPYYCKFCRKCFTNFSSLSDHAQLMHTDTANPYHCEFCYLRFPDFPALAHHMDQMHSEDAYSCQVCYHTFADYSSVARHAELTHKHRANVPLAPYMCRICREAHYIATDLIIHARVIHGYTWADLAQDLAECLQKPIRFQDEHETIVCPQETSDSGQMIKLASSISANTNDRIPEPETSSPDMVLGSNSVLDRWKAAKMELESLLDLLRGAVSQDSHSHRYQTSPGKLQVGPSALRKNTWMSGIPGGMSSPSVYINAVKKRIQDGKVHDHTYTCPPGSLHLVEHEDEKDVDDVETQPQSQILSKQEAATNPQQRHLKTLVGSQNGTVVPTKIALSSMQPVVSLVNMKSLLRGGVFCKPRIKLLLLDANGKPRRRQPYLEQFYKKYSSNVYERKRREKERFYLLALGEEVPALISKDRVTKDNILNYSTEYILTLRNEEEKLLAAKEMERQRHELLQGRLRNLQVGNVVTYSLAL